MNDDTTPAPANLPPGTPPLDDDPIAPRPPPVRPDDDDLPAPVGDRPDNR